MASNPQDQVQSWYQQYLGRQGAPGEISHWTSSVGSDPNWATTAEGAIKGSAEATAYQKKAGQQTQQQQGAPQQQGTALGGATVPPYQQWTAGMQSTYNQPPPGGLTPPAAGTYKPGALGGSQATPYQQYNFVPLHGVNYGGMDFSQYTGGGQTAGGNAAAMTALQKVLSDPSGLDASALKNRLKEQALFMEKDQQEGLLQSAASRGMSASGATSGELADLAGNTRSEILRGFRDIDIADAELSNQNRIAGANAMGQLTGQMTEQDVANYMALLEGQAAQADDNRFASEFALDKESTLAELGMKDNQFAFDSGLALDENQRENFLTQEGVNEAGAESALENWRAGLEPWQMMNENTLEMRKADVNELLGRLGIDVSLEEIASKDRQTKMSFIVDVLDLLLRQQQHNQQLGLDYNRLGMNAQDVMNTLVQGLRI